MAEIAPPPLKEHAITEQGRPASQKQELRWRGTRLEVAKPSEPHTLMFRRQKNKQTKTTRHGFSEVSRAQGMG